VSAEAVLYDVPGPRARRRHALGSAVGAAVLIAALGFVGWRLAEEGQFDASLWAPFANGQVWTNTLLRGLVNTLRAAAVAVALACLWGGLLAAGRLSGRALVRLPAVVVVELFRAIPLLLLILFLFLAFGDRLGAFWSLVLGLVLYNGAVLAEIFRAGIHAVPRGQAEAAYSLGLRKGQVMRIVLVPQAVRSMLPAIVSQCVVTLKDTALGFIIAYEELVRTGRLIYEGFNNIVPTAIVIGAIYVALNFALSRLAGHLEARQRRAGRPAVRAGIQEDAGAGVARA
jgi:glutamate transport system permease protein